MVQRLKRKVQEMLDRKRVSMAMIYDRDGHILWHHGREIHGRSIDEARGFCREAVRQSLENGATLCKEPRPFFGPSQVDSGSPGDLMGSVIIRPLNSAYFFYVDSGSAAGFSPGERREFEVIFEIMDEVIGYIRHSQLGIGGITGESPAIRELREQVLRFAVEDEPVLLTGETGVGKNHIAALIHHYSGRNGPFVVAHTPAIPEQLFEREFFGHCRGAFTDARSDRSGLVASARGGTLFLDEITEVPISFQAKLLRFIESGKFRPLGDVQERQSDVRVISASNQDVMEMVSRRCFREDLFYRIQVLQIHIPPLRERPEDIHALVNTHRHFLKGKELTDGFWEVVTRHDWPGNIRELFTVLKRAGILLKSPITAEAINYVIDSSCYREKVPANGNDGTDEIWRRLQEGETFWDVVRKPFLERELNRSEVVELIDRGLRLCRGRYRNVLELFNLPPGDYKRFMNFVHQHRLRPS